jgi:hypothetical protein
MPLRGSLANLKKGKADDFAPPQLTAANTSAQDLHGRKDMTPESMSFYLCHGRDRESETLLRHPRRDHAPKHHHQHLEGSYPQMDARNDANRI